MAKTKTRTWTKTFTRTQVLAFQVNFVVRSTTGDTTFEQLLEKGIVNNHWIKLIDVYGLDKKGNIHAQIIMTIDWDQHELHIKANQGDISLDEHLPEGERLDFAIGKIVQFFNKLVKEEKLKTEWRIEYVPGVDKDVVRGVMGTSPASPLRWADGEVIHVQKLYPEKLNEFSISLSLLAPEGTPEDPGSKQRGTVKWFNEQKGYGFITPDADGKDIFVHYSDIVGDDWRVLRDGQIVEFDTEETIKGEQAVNVTVIE